MRRLLLGLFCLLSGCASGPRMWTPVQRPSAASCAAPGAPTDAPWQLVSAPGFTFCVPSDWRTSDGRTWHGAGGSVTWGLGTPPRRVGPPMIVEMRVPPGGGMPSPAAIQAAAAAQGAPQCSTYRRSEKVGGQVAELYDTECNGEHHTGARWESAGVYLQGEGGMDGTASVQLQVYRTVRFVPQSGP